MKDSLTAIGRGATIVGLLFVLAGSRGNHPSVLLTGQILIGIGIVLLIVHFWTRSQQ
jgi:hypothetical protein